MRTITKISTLLLSLLLVASCSQEAGQTAQPVAEVTTPSQAVKVQADLTVGTEDLRVYQDVSTTTKTTPTLTESDLNVRVVVTYNGVSEHQTLVFKKVQGQNKATYQGYITVPAVGTGNYTITAALLSQADGTVYATLSGNTLQVKPATSLLVAENNIVKSTVPYIAQTTTTASTDGKALQKASLTFKPSGTLLRIKVQNMTGRTDTFKSVKIKTNAFVTNWSYNLEDYKGGNLAEGTATSTAETEYEFSLPASVTLADEAIASDAYYIWVMPTKETTLSTKIYTTSANGYDYLGFKKTTAINAGKLTTATVQPLPHMPITYFEPNPLTSTVDPNLADTDNIDPSGPYRFISDTDAVYYNSRETQYIMNLGDFQVTKTVNGQEVVGTYYMPSHNEVRSIFPSHSPSINWTQALTETTENNVSFPWAPSTTISNAKVTYLGKDGVVYALRFQGYKNNRFLMAYKYEKVGTFALNSTSAVRITSRYIGTDGASSVTINTIADPAYWATDNEDDASATLYALGWANSDRVPMQYGSTGHMFLGNPASTRASYLRFDNETSGNLQSIRPTQPKIDYTRPIRLFIRK